MTEYRLGTAIPVMISFHRITKPKQFTTTKVVVTMVGNRHIKDCYFYAMDFV
jgi:hypothetical protein